MNTYAFVFPGQGSQSIGMLSDIYATYPQARDVFHIASDTVGYDIWDLITNGPETQLNQTAYTQVAMLTADMAVWHVIKEHVNPHAMAGHSLGEYAALVSAEALSLQDAVKLVDKRGKHMQACVPHNAGAMAAIIGLDASTVSELCQKASTDKESVTPANYNAPEQTVIAGHTEAVHRAIQLAEAAEARMAKIIPVSVPCHCALLKEASIAFTQDLESTPFKIPNCLVFSNVDCKPYQDISAMKQALAKQLYSPVQWVKTIIGMRDIGITHIVECGPGKVLTGLNKRIDKHLATLTTGDVSNISSVISIS